MSASAFSSFSSRSSSSSSSLVPSPPLLFLQFFFSALALYGGSSGMGLVDAMVSRPLRMVQRKPRKAGWAQVLSRLGEMGAGWLAGLGYIVFGLGLDV